VRDDGSTNLLHLTAAISEREALRYTPAGIPVVNASLQHESEQMEAGVVRKIEFEVAALAAGEISGKFGRAPLGVALDFIGFLARKSRNSKGLVFHVTDIKTPLPDSNTGAQDGIR